ncbi:UNVERIFIED_CONTAM: Chitinase 1 [Siphonaria sp. JEL0065]|nr:Chitinase 1 [Siphonaria sp. JEL0065]
MNSLRLLAVAVIGVLAVVSGVEGTKCKVKSTVVQPRSTGSAIAAAGFVAKAAPAASTSVIVPPQVQAPTPAPAPQEVVDFVAAVIPDPIIPLPPASSTPSVIPTAIAITLDVVIETDSESIEEPSETQTETESLQDTQGPTPAPAPQPEINDPEVVTPVTTSAAISKPPPQQPQDGTIKSLIDEQTFNHALSACGISKSGLYNGLTTGFTAPITGFKELALLLGNTAHESGSFQFTEEINCKGVTSVTPLCAYGWYHGRGYIQLSWKDNYAKAADALGRPEILSNPDIIMNDESVNWATVQWYWTSTVQPYLRDNGYTLGNSVKSINGYIECGGNPISPQRVKFIQCFETQLLGGTTDTTWC